MKFDNLKIISETLKSTGYAKFSIEFYKDGKTGGAATESYCMGLNHASYFLANNLQNHYTATIEDNVITCKAKKPKKHVFIIKGGK